MSVEQSFATLFQDAMRAQRMDDCAVAKQVHSKRVIIESYISGQSIPENKASLAKFRFLFPSEEKWNEINATWERQNEAKKFEINPFGWKQHDGEPEPGRRSGRLMETLRRKHRMGQRELLKQTGISQILCGLVERGDALLTPQVFQKVLSSSLCRTAEERTALLNAYNDDLTVAKGAMAR